MITYRTATPADAAALARLGADSFTRTFGHLYSAADLALFLSNHTAEGWQPTRRSPFAVRVAEVEGAMIGYIKLAPPPALPRPTLLSNSALYVLAPCRRHVAATPP